MTMDETMKTDLLDQAQPVQEVEKEKVEEAPRNKEVRQRRDGPSPYIGGEVGVDIAEAVRRVCDERNIHHYEFLQEWLPKAVAHHDAQKEANATGGLVLSGMKNYVLINGSVGDKAITYVAPDLETARKAAARMDRVADDRWKALERIKTWKQDTLRTNKALPEPMRAEADHATELRFQQWVTSIDETMPINFMAKTTIVEVDEIVAVPDQTE
jgi:hypothetical protein